MSFEKTAIDPRTGPQPFTHLLVLDFEATCMDGQLITPQEIIEFPIVVVELTNTDPKTGRVIPTITTTEFHCYVKPTAHPILTEFCKELTGIQQESVDRADEWPTVWDNVQVWIKNWEDGEKKKSGRKPRWAFVTCGDWDLKTMLPGQVNLTGGGRIPSSFQEWVNIKVTFKCFYGLKKTIEMPGMLKKLNLALEGHYHSGIDDTRNIARIVKRMVEDGCFIKITGRMK